MRHGLVKCASCDALLLAARFTQQVVSGIVTLGVMGAVAYWWLTKDDKSDVDLGASSKPKPKSGKDDLDDPLADARRIMDKYK